MNAFIGAVLGFALLPACAVHFLKYWKESCGGISITTIKFSSSVGFIGIGYLICLLVYMITNVPPPTSPYHDNFMNFSQGDTLIILFGLFYGAVLLPAVGLIFLARGLEYRKHTTEPG